MKFTKKQEKKEKWREKRKLFSALHNEKYTVNTAKGCLSIRILMTAICYELVEQYIVGALCDRIALNAIKSEFMSYLQHHFEIYW